MRKLIAALLFAWSIPAVYGAVTLTESTSVGLYKGTSKVRDYPGWTQCQDAARAAARVSTATTGTVTYACKTEVRKVIATYTADSAPTPAPTPDPIPTPVPAPIPTGATYTDLSSAPACAAVTVYPSRAVVTPTEAGVPIHAGRCLSATPATLKAVWAGVLPGDVVTLRAGTYSGIYGEATWKLDSNMDTRKQGTATQPIALVAAPGELVTFTGTGHENFAFADGNGAKARYITLAGVRIVNPSSCITAGGDTSTDRKPESGGEYIRIVGVTCTITDATGNTMTGLISIQGDGWKVLGNTFVDPANRTVINNNHVVYVQNGADDVEIAYNTFRNLHVGFVVQIHQDGAPMLYERVNVHDNTFEAANPAHMRGVTTSNIQSASTVTFARNTFRNLGGGGWGCINVYSGQVALTGNDCQNTQNGLNVNGQTSNTRKITMSSNKLCPAAGYSRINYENGASASQVTETNPLPCL